MLAYNKNIMVGILLAGKALQNPHMLSVIFLIGSSICG